MIVNKFKNSVLAVAGAVATVAAPAYAGKDFVKKDLQHETVENVHVISQVASENSVTFSVFGGLKGQQIAVYEVAQQLDEEGKAVSLILGPDRDDKEQTVTVYIFADGQEKELIYGIQNNNDYSEFKNKLYDAASPIAPSKPSTLALK